MALILLRENYEGMVPIQGGKNYAKLNLIADILDNETPAIDPLSITPATIKRYDELLDEMVDEATQNLP